MSGTCSCYCVGPVHIHPQQATVSQDLLMVGEALAGVPGLLIEAASYQAQAQPLTEKIVDHIYLGFMGLLALGSAPMLVAGAGLAYAGEKVLDTIDVLHGMRKRVDQFGRSLSEQEKIIEEFGPLLELSDKVADLSKKAEQKKQELQKSTQELDELAVNYTAHANLLVRVSDLITRLQTVLIKRISNTTGLREKTLTQRVHVIKQITEEEQQMKLLAARLNGLMNRVGEKADRWEKLEVQMTVLAEVKGESIDGLQSAVDSLPTTLQEPADVLPQQVMA